MVVVGRRGPRKRGTELGIARARCQSGVVVPAKIQTPAARAHVVHIDYRAVVELMLNSKIPLHGVWILYVRVGKPRYLAKWIRCGKHSCNAIRERVGRLGVGHSRNIQLVVEIIGDFYTDIGPGSDVILRRLRVAGPVIKEYAK